jgi:glucose 1-dehydrogenase
VLNVNLRSVFLFCKYSVPHMPQGSAIVNVSSVHAHETTRNVVPYASSKGGIEAFTRGFAEELAPRKIRINCVAPGAVDTPMLWDNPNVKNGIEKVEGAIGKPEDIAAAICFLAAPEARFITGTTSWSMADVWTFFPENRGMSNFMFATGRYHSCVILLTDSACSNVWSRSASFV